MTAEFLSTLFGYTHRSVQMNVAGLSHEEALVAPEPDGNSMNWVIGHILASRNAVHKLVGEPPLWSDERAAPYVRGSKPLDVTRAVPLAELMADLDRSQAIIQAAFGRMTDEDLAAPFAGMTVGGKLGFLQFHEAYHAGQTGTLRRIAGKEGAIK